MKKGLLLFSVLIILIGCRPVNKELQRLSGDMGQDARVLGDSAKRLADYHWFEEKYQSIKSEIVNAQLYAEEGEDVKGEISIINRWIGEYNARSNAYDRDMWKDGRLPDKLKSIRSVNDLKNYEF